MAQSFVGFILHSAPVACTIKRIQFFCGYLIRRKYLFREIFQIRFPLSFFLMVTSGWKYFLRSRFRDRQIAAAFCLIKEGQLTIYGIQRFCVFSETIAVRYAYLFDQPLDVLIQGIQRPCIIRTMVISSSRLQLFSSSSVCLSAIVPLLKLFLLYQKTQRIANRHPRRFRHSAYACMAV